MVLENIHVISVVAHSSPTYMIHRTWQDHSDIIVSGLAVLAGNETFHESLMIDSPHASNDKTVVR